MEQGVDCAIRERSKHSDEDRLAHDFDLKV